MALESGLELELFRELDARQDVTWIVSQPVRLEFIDSDGSHIRHVPDLLSLTADGQIELWDCRPRDRIDDAFNQAAEATQGASHAVGWTYTVFSGSTAIRRANFAWLTAYRNPEPWHESARQILERLAADHPQLRLGDVTNEDHSGLATAALWHAIYVGELTCDLDHPLTTSTIVTLRG